MFKLLKLEVHKIKKHGKAFTTFCKFCNNTDELTNLPEIPHKENVEAEFHKISAKFVTPTTVYGLTNPIRSKILDVNNFFFLTLLLIVFSKFQILNHVVSEILLSYIKSLNIF